MDKNTGRALHYCCIVLYRQVISGLNKFDADLVSKVARAAAAGGGTHIDIACDPDLVRAAKAVSNVPVRERGEGGGGICCLSRLLGILTDRGEQERGTVF